MISLKKTNDFYKCTKILVWFSVSVDFISSGAIVYGVIDDLYQLVIQYFGENKKTVFDRYRLPSCNIIWFVKLLLQNAFFLFEGVILYDQM